MYLTEQNIVENQQQNLLLLENQMVKQKFGFEEIGEFIPGLFHVNDLDDVSVKYMNNTGEEYFNKSSNEIVDLKEDFLIEICHTSVFEELIPQLSKFYKMDDDKKVMGFYQRLRRNQSSEFHNLLGFTKISKRLNCFVSIENPVSIFGEMAQRLNRLLDDNEFLRKNFRKFASLTKQEIEIIKQIGIGNSRSLIAEMLHISKHTLDNHRKNIRQKLEIKSTAELFHYIHAFDLLN